MHIILDIDGTLISEDHEHIFRPYLKEFLEYLFENFQSVSLWSAAGLEHVNTTSDIILPAGRDWLFLRHSRHCHYRYVSGFGGIYDGKFIVEKRLRNLWKAKRYRDMGLTKQQTLIIDNTPRVCRKNYGNAIYVPTFNGEQDDTVLPDLIKYLDTIKDVKNVRTIEKRHWRNTIK